MEGNLGSRTMVSLFDQQIENFFENLEIVGKDFSDIRSTSNEEEPIKYGNSGRKNGFSADGEFDNMGKTGMTCSVCLVAFESVEIQRQHFKLDWHRFNLKQKLIDKPILSEEAFEQTISGDVSSISGSDSDTDVDKDLTLESNHFMALSINSLSEETIASKSAPAGRHHPKVVFLNGNGDVLSVYRSVLYSVKNIPSTSDSLLSLFTDLPKKKRWLVLMTAGGHFAGAVFNGKDVVLHKTFHRYTVRAKRGTAQGTRDAQQGGKQPKSAGASLRRYNEAALVQEIQDLLKAWSTHVEQCDRIFLRTPVYNKSIFFGGKKPPFRKEDDRVRTIPFPTRRPTFNEVKRVHQELSNIQLLGNRSDSALQDFLNELIKPKTSHLPWSGDGKVQLWQEKNALDASIEGEACENKSTTDETDSTLHETNSSEDVPTKAFKGKLQEGWKKSKRKKSKGKKVVDTLHDGENVSPEQHLWNRLYCAIVSDNTEVISLLGVKITGTEKDDSRNRESLSLQQEKIDQTTEHGESISMAAEQTTTNQTAACFENDMATEQTTTNQTGACFENDLDAVTSCVRCHGNGEVTNETRSCQRTFMLKTERSGEPEGVTKQGNPYLESFRSSFPGRRKTEEITLDDTRDKSVAISDIISARLGETGDTLLHVASRSSRTHTVATLLAMGADPAVKDDKGRPPYVVAGNKETRNEFRRFMASFPDRYDYGKAQIPSALTQEMQNEKERKNAERKKAQKKAQKQRAKEQKTAQRKKEEEEEEKEKEAFKGLSEREKRALAAEKRFARQLKGKETGTVSCCAWCCKSLLDQVPFERLTYKYCGTACVRAHRLHMEEQQR